MITTDGETMTKEEVRVVIVDDDDDVRDVLRLFVEADGYTALTVSDGAGALEAVRHFKPACVLLDLAMPGVDGVEVTRQLRREIGSWLVIVGITAVPAESEHARLESAGVDFILTKPVDAESLRRLLPPLCPSA